MKVLNCIYNEVDLIMQYASPMLSNSYSTVPRKLFCERSESEGEARGQGLFTE